MARGGVLVTGGRGFAGTHLLEQLGERGVATPADVTDPEAVAAAIGAARPAAVVHLAAASSVAASWRSGSEVWLVNAVGTVNVLDAVRRERPEARVLVASTGEAYGETAARPAREDDPLLPVSPYAASKAAAEVACRRAARVDGLDVVTARPFQHIGPGQEERFAIGSWTRQVARLEERGGGDLEVGNLEVERDLTDVRDVCRAYRLLLDPAVPPGLYNVSSGTAVRLRDVVDLLVGLARCPVTVRENPARMRPVDIRVLAGDPSRLTAATGWQPEIPLEQSVADALADARRLGRAEAVPSA